MLSSINIYLWYKGVYLCNEKGKVPTVDFMLFLIDGSTGLWFYMMLISSVG